MARTANRTATYDRPVEAHLVVRLANGEEWLATEEDLAKFGCLDTSAFYHAFCRHLQRVLVARGLLPEGVSLEEAKLNPLRNLVEIAVLNPDALNDPALMEDTDNAIASIERLLQMADRVPDVNEVTEEQE